MDQVKFVEKTFEGLWSALSRVCTFKIFKGCILQVFIWSIVDCFVKYLKLPVGF